MKDQKNLKSYFTLLNEKPIKIKTSFGNLPIVHPNQQDIPQLLAFLHDHDSDTRGFEPTAHKRHTTLGENKLRSLWRQTNLLLAKSIDIRLSDSIKLQSEGIVESTYIQKKKGIQIQDPFCMKQVEKRLGINKLQQIQLQNTLVVKKSALITACARLLNVEGEVELVDLAVLQPYQKHGIASRLIQEILSSSTYRPIYSFMTANPKLIHFYHVRFSSEGGFIPVFSKITNPLQKDLAHMNQFGAQASS